MASSTLDSLVLELGLDSKKLTDGMRHVISQLKQDSAEIVTATAAIEKQGTKASEVFKDFTVHFLVSQFHFAAVIFASGVFRVLEVIHEA